MKIKRYIQIVGILTVAFLFTQCEKDDNLPPMGGGNELDFSGTFVQEDIMGRPGINTVFSGSDEVKNNYNTSVVSDRASFQPIFQNTTLNINFLYSFVDYLQSRFITSHIKNDSNLVPFARALNNKIEPWDTMLILTWFLISFYRIVK